MLRRSFAKWSLREEHRAQQYENRYFDGTPVVGCLTNIDVEQNQRLHPQLQHMWKENSKMMMR